MTRDFAISACRFLRPLPALTRDPLPRERVRARGREVDARPLYGQMNDEKKPFLEIQSDSLADRADFFETLTEECGQRGLDAPISRFSSAFR